MTPDTITQAFKAAFLQTLPRTAPKHEPMLWPPPTTMFSEPRKRRSPRRGSGFSYTSGPLTYRGRYGTWARYMVDTIMAHTSTWDAITAHAATGQYAHKTLDFNWMVDKGYITKT